MDIFSLDAEINKLILLQQEGEYWDFKKEWHINKADLLHDIICMANNPSPHDGFMDMPSIIPFQEKKPMSFHRKFYLRWYGSCQN